MVKRFDCRPGDYPEPMEVSKTGYWVSMGDYIKIRHLLRICAESMRDWADNARGEITEVEEAAQEMFNALEDM